MREQTILYNTKRRSKNNIMSYKQLDETLCTIIHKNSGVTAQEMKNIILNEYNTNNINITPRKIGQRLRGFRHKTRRESTRYGLRYYPL